MKPTERGSLEEISLEMGQNNHTHDNGNDAEYLNMAETMSLVTSCAPRAALVRGYGFTLLYIKKAEAEPQRGLGCEHADCACMCWSNEWLRLTFHPGDTKG